MIPLFHGDAPVEVAAVGLEGGRRLMVASVSRDERLT